MKLFDHLFDGNYKRLMAIPAIIFAMLLFMVLIYPKVPLGIDMRGGTSIIVRGDHEIDSKILTELLLKNYPLDGLEITTTATGSSYGAIIQFIENKDFAKAEKSLNDATALLSTNPEQAKAISEQTATDLQKYYSIPKLSDKPEEALNEAKTGLISAKQSFDNQVQALIIKQFNLSEKSFGYQKREIGVSLGKSFWETALFVGFISLILIILVVFAFFREIIPSGAIVFAGLFDVLTALALMGWFKISLSLVSIPALLMLFGYSIDTDVLLTTRVLKRREGTAKERAVDSMKTGLTMTITAIASLGTMFVISYLNQIVVLYEISAILLFGLMGDIIATWLFNAPLILWYVETHKKYA